jgi:hypothetical protein
MRLDSVEIDENLSEDYDEYMEYLADQYEYDNTLTLMEESVYWYDEGRKS